MKSVSAWILFLIAAWVLAIGVAFIPSDADCAWCTGSCHTADDCVFEGCVCAIGWSDSIGKCVEGNGTDNIYTTEEK